MSESDRKEARRLLGQWKRMVSRLRSGREFIHKPFVSTEETPRTVAQLRKLYRVLPRDRWRRRGRTVIKRRSYREIAAELNAGPFPTRSGKPWSAAVVLGILKRLKIWKPVQVDVK